MILVKGRVEVILRLPFLQFSCSDKSVFVRVKRTLGEFGNLRAEFMIGFVTARQCLTLEVKEHPIRLNPFVSCSTPPQSLGFKNGKDM